MSVCYRHPPFLGMAVEATATKPLDAPDPPAPACSTHKRDALDILEQILHAREARIRPECRADLDCAERLRVWYKVERLFNANDPFSPESRDALTRTRVRCRGGGLDAAFKGARSPDREREELDDCEPVVWDKRAVDMEEEYGDDLRTLRHLEERLAHDEAVTDDNENSWFALLGLLRDRPDFATVLHVPQAAQHRFWLECEV